MTRLFKVIHKAGAFIDGVHYPPASDTGNEVESIVPLELAPGKPAPLWGVEVDENFKEIGADPVESIADKLADALANKIAVGAGIKAPLTPTGLADEQRKQTIIETLGLLDASKDDDWTASGLPKVDVVANASGLEGLTREEITAAAPDFKRAVK